MLRIFSFIPYVAQMLDKAVAPTKKTLKFV